MFYVIVFVGLLTAILLYRGMRYARKKNLKISHATLFGIVMGFIVFALVAVFYSHNYAEPKPIPNMYSLHSWVGMGAVVLFGCQVNLHGLYN